MISVFFMESYVRSGYFHWAPLLFSLLSIIHWIFTPLPPTIHVEIQIPNVPVLGDGTLVKWLDHEGRSLMDGISALINNIPESWPPSTIHSTLMNWKKALYRYQISWFLDLGHPILQNYEKCLFFKLPSLWYSVIEVQMV